MVARRGFQDGFMILYDTNYSISYLRLVFFVCGERSVPHWQRATRAVAEWVPVWTEAAIVNFVRCIEQIPLARMNIPAQNHTAPRHATAGEWSGLREG